MIVNAHTHVYSALSPEFDTSGRSFVEILSEHWWRLDRALDAESLRASARLYIAEAHRAGTAALVDHHESPNFIEGSLDVIADACQELGMAALLCYGATERNGGRAEAQRGLAECRRFIETNRRPLVRGAVGLHAAFTVSDETIREAGRLARELSVPLHVHVAEGLVDREGLSRLIANDALLPGTILAHGIHLREAEVWLAEQLGCWFVQNPRSNAANRVGYPTALRTCSRVALGTDGFPSRLADEADALREHESSAVIAERVAAGETLAGELGLPSAEPREFDIETIRAAAARESERLWEKMHEANFTLARGG